MTKSNQNFEMWSGDHKTIIFSITSSSTGAAASLTEASIVWVISQDALSGSMVRLSTDGGISVSGSLVTVNASPAHTSGMAGTYYHELQARDAASNISTLATGNVKINYDVAG